MIRVDSLTKQYRRSRASKRVRPALDAVSLTVERGEIHAVVGPNGAGKSTLFSIVLGFLHPTAGDVTIEGDDPGSYVRRNGAAYLPERFTLPGAWRVGEALAAFARMERLGADAGPRAEAAVARFGLEAELDTPVGELSRGTLQRVGLAQACLAPRELLVFDEPTEGLDPIWRLHLRELLGTLRAEGRTILLASHDLGEVERVADRATVIEEGRIRETIELRAPPGGADYVIRLAEPAPGVADAFPMAEALDDSGTIFRARVDDARELSTRLAALLELGAVVAAVEPVGQPLEERVRAILRATGGDA
jgi:ABC-type multidrug transport system ATPase subunit